MTADRSPDTALQTRMLADVAAAGAWAPDASFGLRRVAELLVPGLADWCAIDLVEDETTYRRLTVVHADPQRHARGAGLLGLWVPDPGRPGVAGVVRTGQPYLATDESDAAGLVAGDDSAGARLVSELGVAGYVSVPLGVDDRTFGVLTLVVADDRRRLADGDVAFAQTLARLAGPSIANARLQRALDDTNRRQDELLAVLSHQLRTPLTAMLAWLQLVRRLDTGAAVHALDTIERNGRALGRLIDDLLDTARILTGKVSIERRPLDLACLVTGAVAGQRTAARVKGVRLDTDLGSLDARYVGDRRRLEQVLAALLDNALRFTPAGGHVVARLDGDGRGARIRVIDSGRGIPAALLPHVFDSFRRGEENAGLGLGLAVARDLVTMHGGTLEAASDGVDRGATFTVRLPLPT
jgi:signal transduction histidine kinase